MKSISVLSFFVTLQVASSTPLSEDTSYRYKHTTTGRQRRSGGYPKFPIEHIIKKEELHCGKREVYHQPSTPGRPGPKVVGGTAAPYGAYPWMVEIKTYQPRTRKFDHHCGGAVVGERLVLTAGHCVQSIRVDHLKVVVGDHRLDRHDQFEKTFKVERVLLHPNFSQVGVYSNDIALLKLKTIDEHGIEFNSHVKSICLPELRAKSTNGMWCTVTGWGAQNPDDLGSLSPVLKVAAVSLLDLNVCRRKDVYGGRHQSILDSMICAGMLEGGVDACGGDSGGPLACEINGRFVLMGIVSWGDGCAKRNRPGVYTRISYFIDWIQQSMEQMGL